jgi:hypothetical protein
VPCYTIRSTGVTFEKVAYQPGHLALLLEALKDLGYQLEAGVRTISLRTHLPSGTAVRIWPAGTYAGVQNTILYKDGKFQIPSAMRDRFTLERIEQAYARQAVLTHAQRNNWLVREISQTEFELTR